MNPSTSCYNIKVKELMMYSINNNNNNNTLWSHYSRFDVCKHIFKWLNVLNLNSIVLNPSK